MLPGWSGSRRARGDRDAEMACRHPGHHRDAVRIAVDGAIGLDDDRHVLGRDAVDGQLNGRRMSLYGEDPGNRPASPVLPDAVLRSRETIFSDTIRYYNNQAMTAAYRS